MGAKNEASRRSGANRWRCRFAVVFFQPGAIFSSVQPPFIPSPLRRAVLTGVAVAGGLLPLATGAMTDYLVDGWGTKNNLPSSSVTSVAQTPDGYLWVGTYDGLARFDGARFVTFDPANTPALSQPRVQDLFLDVQGTLWINTFRGGLTSYRNGVFRAELLDQPTFDLHTSLVYSTSNLVVFVTQIGRAHV